MSASPTPRLDGMLASLVEGTLAPAEAERLERILMQDPAAREQYRWYLAVHLGLQELLQADAGVVALPPPRRRRIWPGLAAAAAVGLAAGLVLWRAGFVPAHRHGQDRGAEVAAGPLLAVTAEAHGVLWDLATPAVSGMPLSAGRIRLRAGDLTLTLVNGQTLAVRGPAELELVNERELRVIAGAASLDHRMQAEPFVTRVPGGAVVSSSDTEFSVNVGDGTDLRVFHGQACASTVDITGRSREEVVLDAGQSARIADSLKPAKFSASAFLRLPAPPATTASPASEVYAAAVVADRPQAYWRFEEGDGTATTRDETGGAPLELMLNAALAGPPGHRFLALDDRRRQGFAYCNSPLGGLDSAGFTIECLIYPASKSHCTAMAIEAVEAAAQPPEKIHHTPQFCVIERMARMGEHIGHVHPDYAMRAMLRFPAGYVGGTNLYSAESHLLHRWRHAVLTCDGRSMRLYLDGRPTDEAKVGFSLVGTRFRPIIGRLQPDPRDEARQWVGGIDEVAIYPKVLDEAAIRRHWEALAAPH